MKLFCKKKNIVIIGCGTIGSALASDASICNYNVTVIDKNSGAFLDLPSDFNGYTIVGDGTQMEVLLSAGIPNADCLITATNDDDVNIMIAQIASVHFKLSQVIVRVNDFYKKSACDELNIQTLCPAELTVNEIEKVLDFKREEKVG